MSRKSNRLKNRQKMSVVILEAIYKDIDTALRRVCKSLVKKKR